MALSLPYKRNPGIVEWLALVKLFFEELVFCFSPDEHSEKLLRAST